MTIRRRDFIKSSSAAVGGMLIPGVAQASFTSRDFTFQKAPIRVSQLKKPLAIAMWDYS
ncbi:MAG: twin-arginine translocation signal domain-containing protein [Bacteroidetes bacterium]|jgi:hypothetical protein|nr:twin-arginine translocation signal domain-containing protein [Bacteroidota bacterium]MBT3750215.1 twin-arginine translocation signal domain-containing protein [Bacteroidota bacterium]MBT4398797.1 twin-arginine translocation signal domain-containing protein [Bacteroidota bacterium]MBT4412005.1 twin-arginine translocation signal domain-containing protein [Bacteroidota bacterium]MBT5426079.1 twin-arginine translocation signal domain-containing protein [Bacteroidota bacterium]